MATFSAKTHAEATVLAPQQQIWDALVDPGLMARFTPFLNTITADGDHWLWQMSGLSVAGKKIAPSFTEKMVFDEPDRIEFHHDPPSDADEFAGVEGWYQLTPAEDAGSGDGNGDGAATLLVTELEISVELPLPRAAGPAVRATMRKVVDSMGDKFSANLLDHLGTQAR